MTNPQRPDALALVAPILDTPLALREGAERALARAACDFLALDAARHEALAAEAARPSGPAATMAGSVAVVPISGVIMQRDSALLRYLGGTSTEKLGQQLDALDADPNVAHIVLDVNSPGGTVPGVPELAAKIRALGTPVTAIANPLAASAAYWLASAAGELVVTPSGDVGSVGVFMLHASLARMFETVGIDVSVIKSGRLKAAGNPYEPLSDEARAYLQAGIDDVYADFTKDVAKHRGVAVSAVREGFGEGGVVGARRAKAEGMVDHIATLAQTMKALAKRRMPDMRMQAAADPLAARAALADATEPKFADGTRVRALADHGMGMKGKVGKVAEGHAGDPPYYAVLFDGDKAAHKWFNEPELEPEGAKASARAGAARADAPDFETFARNTLADIAAGLGINADATPPSAVATAGPLAAVPSLTLVAATSGTVPTFRDPAPKAEENPVDDTNTAAHGAATQPDAAAQAQQQAAEMDRRKAIRALGREHNIEASQVDAWIDSGAGVGAVKVAIFDAGREKQKAAPQISAVHDRRVDEPWKHAGAFFEAVIQAGTPNAPVDVRLAAAQGMNQQIPSQGGFLVPPQFANSIWEGVQASTTALLPMTDNYTVTGESLTFPANGETSRANGSRWGGIRGYWLNEADQLTKSAPKFRSLKLEPQQMGVLVYLTEKLMRNSPIALEQYVTRAAASEVEFMTNDAILNGDGTGKPLGLFSSSSLVTVTKETSQAASTILSENISKMWRHLPPASRARAVWLIGFESEPFLDSLNAVVKNVAGTENVGGYAPKVYDPEKNTIKGRPVMVVEQMPAASAAGDLTLWDPLGYATGTRGGIESAQSMHVRFEYAETALRFLYEVDGQPWLADSLTPFKGSAKLTTHVALGAR